MTKRTWRFMTGAMVALSLGGLASLGWSQGPRWRGSGWYDTQAPVQYRLTREQVRKMDEIQAKYAEKLDPLEKELASVQGELDAAWSRGDVPAEKVTRLRHQVRDIEGQIEDLQAEANTTALQGFTPEQRAYYGSSFGLYDIGTGSSCPWDRHWQGGSSAGRWTGAGSRDMRYQGMGCGSCW